MPPVAMGRCEQLQIFFSYTISYQKQYHTKKKIVTQYHTKIFRDKGAN